MPGRTLPAANFVCKFLRKWSLTGMIGRDAIFDRRSLPPGSCQPAHIRSPLTEPGSRRAFTRLDISSSFQRLALKREEICLRLKRLRQVTATHHLSTNYSLRWIVAVRDHRKGKRTDCWRLNAKQSFIFSFPVVSVPSALMAPIGTSPPLFLGQLLARKRVETQKQLFPTNNSLGNSVSGWRCSGIWRILFPLAPDPSTSRKENSSDESSPLTRRNMRYETTHQEFSFPSDANSQPPKNSYGGGWLVSDGHMTAFTRTIVAVMWEEVLIDRFLFPVDQ